MYLAHHELDIVLFITLIVPMPNMSSFKEGGTLQALSKPQMPQSKSQRSCHIQQQAMQMTGMLLCHQCSSCWHSQAQALWGVQTSTLSLMYWIMALQGRLGSRYDPVCITGYLALHDLIVKGASDPTRMLIPDCLGGTKLVLRVPSSS